MKSHAVDLEQLKILAETFATRLMPKKEGAAIITLSGELGAGKTAFAKALARAYGIEEEVTSPTFVIEKIYIPTKGPFSRFIHIDAYRLHGTHDLEMLGWEELIQSPGNLILLEWPEKVEGAVPPDSHRISLQYVDEFTRTITHDFPVHTK